MARRIDAGAPSPLGGHTSATLAGLEAAMNQAELQELPATCSSAGGTCRHAPQALGQDQWHGREHAQGQARLETTFRRRWRQGDGHGRPIGRRSAEKGKIAGQVILGIPLTEIAGIAPRSDTPEVP